MLEKMRAMYLMAVDALCRRYPGQEQNRPHYEAWAARAELGTLKRRVRTKGGYTDLPKGSVVLFADEDDPVLPDTVSVWAPRADGGENRTLVSAKHVTRGTTYAACQAACETCGGSGVVFPHPTALVTMRCPTCG